MINPDGPSGPVQLQADIDAAQTSVEEADAKKTELSAAAVTAQNRETSIKASSDPVPEAARLEDGEEIEFDVVLTGLAVGCQRYYRIAKVTKHRDSGKVLLGGFSGTSTGVDRYVVSLPPPPFPPPPLSVCLSVCLFALN